MVFLQHQAKMSFKKEKYNEINAFLKEISEKNKQNMAKIIAVTKTQHIDDINQAINYGVKDFAENKVQEAFSKFFDIKRKYSDLSLHMTGPIQTNKVKKSLEIFDYFHTLDREKLAKEFKKYSERLSKKKFFIQVNTGEESQKSGIFIKNLDDFIKYCTFDLKLNIIGLMCIPPINDLPKKHFDLLFQKAKKNNLSFLSMGMSSDYEEAVHSGATHIRIGTALFEKRV